MSGLKARIAKVEAQRYQRHPQQDLKRFARDLDLAYGGGMVKQRTPEELQSLAGRLAELKGQQ